MFQNLSYTLLVTVLVNVDKACTIVWMVSETITDEYINKYLTRAIISRAIYNIQVTLIKWWNNISCVVWNDTFNACDE